jgi:hypothetical protein
MCRWERDPVEHYKSTINVGGQDDEKFLEITEMVKLLGRV